MKTLQKLFPRICAILPAIVALSSIPGLGEADPATNSDTPRAISEIIYVPAYSEVFTKSGDAQQLAVTVVVHNVDSESPIQLLEANYHNDQGQKIRSLLSEATAIPPLATWSALIDIADKTGGVGANFVIEWASNVPASPPITEAIMIGGSGTQGISFTSRGRVISRTSVQGSANSD